MPDLRHPSTMQDKLFDDPPGPPPSATLPVEPPVRQRRASVSPAPPDAALQTLASSLPERVRLGTSSWTYPGWSGLVWDGDYPDAQLSKEGLTAYAQHSLMRTVSLDRGFYRPLTEGQYGVTSFPMQRTGLAAEG